MGEGSFFIEIVIFAMIAAFLVYRLRSVLGRRHGEERQRPNPYAAPRPGQGTSPGPVQEHGDNVISLPERGRVAPEWSPASGEPFSVAQGLAQIRANDPNFDEKHFLQGARSAFEMIVAAFAAGDTAALRPLLSDEVHGRFADAISTRNTAGHVHETQIHKIKDADLIEARMDGRNAVVTVKFVSDQVNVTRDTHGHVVDGDPAEVVEATDIWTFVRNTRARNPNWVLVETRVPH